MNKTGIETANEITYYFLSYFEFIIFLLKNQLQYQEPTKRGINKIIKNIVISVFKSQSFRFDNGRLKAVR